MRKYFLPLLVITILFACKKEDFSNNISSATLHFSTDTITFDTVIEPIEANTVSKVIVSVEKCKVALEILLLKSSFLQAKSIVITSKGRKYFLII
jgi:hypothetical protein